MSDDAPLLINVAFQYQGCNYFDATLPFIVSHRSGEKSGTGALVVYVLCSEHVVPYLVHLNVVL